MQTTSHNDSFLHLSQSTPYHFESNWIIKIENHNRNCTHAEIDTLSSRGILGFIDFRIIELLAQYKFLNTYILSYALTSSLPPYYRRESYTRNLKKLVKAGIIFKHAIYEETSTLDSAPKSPLRFYSLSPGAYSYISPFIKNPSTITYMLPDYKIIECLALNQFLVRLEFNTENVHQKILYSKKHIGKHCFYIDCFFKYAAGPPLSSYISIFLFCYRLCTDSQNDFITRLHLFFRWLNQHLSEHSNYLILILCETITNIELIHRSIQVQNIPTNFSVYYTTDANVLSSSSFKSLYQCLVDEDTNQLIINHVHLTL